MPFKILHESNRKPKKIWPDKGSKFYNRSRKSFLQINNKEMYSTHTEYCIPHIDKLDEIVHKYNNTCHKTIKMRPVDVSPIM